MKTATKLLIKSFFEHHPELNHQEDSIVLICTKLTETFKNGGKLLLCGNGGSAADCDHIVGELIKGFMLDRPLNESIKRDFEEKYGARGALMAKKLQQGLPAISLCAHSAAISAFANDVDPELVFAQQVTAYGRKGDMLIGISTSGNAKNVCAAVIASRVLGLETVALTGKDGGELARLADIALIMPDKETYLIQEHHIAVYHLICAAVENELFYA